MFYLLLKVKETILILVKIGEHMETLSFTDVVDHIVLQELIDVVGRNFSQLHAVNSLECSPGLEPMLLCELLPLLFHYFLIL